MKKTIRKPENWQDFETLCKKLWGEIWEIPSKIKKNGRLGQAQSGVDVYGKPKGEINYWGIQCKGKDDYTNAKLKKREIDKEIEKAKIFKPKLDVFIFATTANKDAEIEEYIRIKDSEHQKNDFEILLYSWEDIADLIEENRDTFNWYINEIGFRENYSVDIYFNDFEKELTVKPKYKRYTTKYQLKNSDRKLDLLSSIDLSQNNIPLIAPLTIFDPLKSNCVNRAWCDFDIVIENSGNKVFEDWKFRLMFKSGIREIYDPWESIMTAISNGLPLDKRTMFVYNDDKLIRYIPLDNAPLIQKDNRYFEVSILPDKYANEIIIEWEILARDFSDKGEMIIKIEPFFIYKEIIIDVYNESEIQKDEIEILDFVEEIDKNKA